jgi:energy-converting hydrogenase Eha subunit A
MNLANQALATFESRAVLAPGEIRKASGSCWNGASADLIGQLGNWLASQLSAHNQRRVEQLTLSRFNAQSREIHLATGWIPFVKPPMLRGSTWICQCPDWLVDVDQIQVGPNILSRGVDFKLTGGALILSDNVVSNGVVGWNITGQTYQPQRFWANVLGFTDLHPGSLKFYSAVLDAGRYGLNQVTFSNLVSAATGVPCVTKDSRVVRVIPASAAFPTPMVVTEHETIAGPKLDVAAVAVGDQVAAGDFVYSSVRVWDCQSPPPSFINQLKIWPTYFSYPGTRPLTVTASPAAPTFATIGGKVRTRFPLVGDVLDINAFFAAQDAREDASGITLLQALSEDLNPVPANLSSARNWVEVLWKLWLRYGAVVTYISSTDPVLPEVDFRLQQSRRCIPPWITHLIQYVPSPNKTTC